jgi:uncharacterized protein
VTGPDLPRIEALFRYPVKSMLGESPAELTVDARGIAGDRWFAVLDPDGKLGSGKSSKRFRRMEGLLRCSARYDAGTVLIRVPDGRELPAGSAADAVSEVVGRPVTLGTEAAVKHLDGPAVHLLSTAALRRLGDLLPDAAIEVERFRPNLLVDVPGATAVEDGWVGRELEIGGVRLRVTERTPRCVMVTMDQRKLPEDRRVLRTLADTAGGAFGISAEVITPGTIRVGDPVCVR